MTREKVVGLFTLLPSAVTDAESYTADELNAIWRAHGSALRLPANPTPRQIAVARWGAAMYASIDTAAAERVAEDARVARLVADPERKAAYDAARAECYFDTEALFPGWVPEPPKPLTPAGQRDAEYCARLALEHPSPPPWADRDPVAAALLDEASRLWPLSHGRSAQARAISEEAQRLGRLGARLIRQDSRRRRRETPGTWPRMVPWPSDCQVCAEPIDPAAAWPHPLSESLGHEPPIIWVARHPEYDGPRVLRPEHWVCNLSKGRRPDWEIPEDVEDDFPDDEMEDK